MATNGAVLIALATGNALRGNSINALMKGAGNAPK
jgi:hypothetical protein